MPVSESSRREAEQRLREAVHAADLPQSERDKLLTDIKALASIDVVSVTQAAEILGVKSTNIDRVRGLPEPVLRVPQQYRMVRYFDRAEIEWLAQNPQPRPSKEQPAECVAGHDLKSEGALNSAGRCKRCEVVRTTEYKRRRKSKGQRRAKARAMAKGNQEGQE